MLLKTPDRAGAADAAAKCFSTAGTWPRLAIRELAAQRIRFGFVFQGAALFDSMTVGQNVAFPLRAAYRLRRLREIDEIVLGTAGRSRLAGNMIVYKKPAELSGGMRKRVGLARALAMNPEVMLYDEPTTGLDPIMSDVINELILRTRNRNPVTSVVVTHDMHTAPRWPTGWSCCIRFRG